MVHRGLMGGGSTGLGATARWGGGGGKSGGWGVNRGGGGCLNL